MAIVEKSALVPYSAQTMFDIVHDVAMYPEFLPWCRSSRVESSSDTEICGTIEVSKAGVTQSFTTCNQLNPPEHMTIKLKQGPFKKLEGAWEFKVLKEDACKVSLMLEFHFSSGLMDRAFGVVFEKIANTLVDSFCQRAQELHRG